MVILTLLLLYLVYAGCLYRLSRSKCCKAKIYTWDINHLFCANCDQRI